MIILNTSLRNIMKTDSISTSRWLISTSLFIFDLIEPCRLKIVEDTISSDGILSKCFPALVKAKFRLVCSDMPAERRGHLSFNTFSPPYPQYCFRKESVRCLRRELISVFGYSHNTYNIIILCCTKSNLWKLRFYDLIETQYKGNFHKLEFNWLIVIGYILSGLTIGQYLFNSKYAYKLALSTNCLR